MKIQLKILNKEFYKERVFGEDLLSIEPRIEYDNLPQYATPGSAALDLVCTEDVVLYPGERKMIATGLAIWIGSAFPYCGQTNNTVGLILPRSGLGTKGLVLANTVGVIDEDYQGELMVSAWNSEEKQIGPNDEEWNGSDGSIYLKAGDRFAQLMFIPVIKAQFDVVQEFSETTERNTGGFNSTGA